MLVYPWTFNPSDIRELVLLSLTLPYMVRIEAEMMSYRTYELSDVVRIKFY